MSKPHSNPPNEWTPNVDVFPNTNEQDEPTVAVNPRNTDNVVVGNHERQGPASPAAILCVSQNSTNGGATWGNHTAMPLQGPVFPAAGGHSCSDSVLTADAGGNFYFAYLDLFRFTAPLRVDVLVDKSTNGGQSYSSTPTLVAKGAGSGAGAEDPDKEWIEADRNAQSPYKGNIYVTYSDFSTFTIKFRKSTDGGASFQPAPTSFGTVVSDVGGQTVGAPYGCGPDTCLDVVTRYMQGSNIGVGPKGEIYVFYGDFTETETFDITTGFSFVNAQMNAAKIMVAKSTDGGTSWTRTVVRDMCSPSPCRSAGTDSHETANTPVFRIGTIPFGGVDAAGRVYATWAEWNSVTFSFDPATNRDFAVSDGNIMFARSTDGGQTWEPAIRVNDDSGTNDQYSPALLAQNGIIHVIWDDRRNDPSNDRYEVFSATSTNNGTSFKANTPVTTASSNPTGTNFVGDYIDIDGASGTMKVNAVWTDRRNVTAPIGSRGNDVFTARRLH